MNAIVEVATAAIKIQSHRVIAIGFSSKPALSDKRHLSYDGATSTVVSISGHSISAVAPDHDIYDWRLALGVAA